MELSEYQNIFNQEDSHFFYVGTHYLIINLLRTYSENTEKPLKILDAGCGTGLLLLKLKKLGEVVGIDISDKAIKFAKTRGLKEIYKTSVEKVPLGNNSFDVVTSIDVIYHSQVRDDIKALKECYRLLKPGGILILKAPAFRWLKGNHDQLVQTKRRYKKGELETKLQTAGFQIKKISYNNMFLLPIIFLKRKLENYIPSLSGTSDVFRLPSFLNKIFTIILKLENCLLKLVDLPFGVSVVAVAKKPNI